MGDQFVVDIRATFMGRLCRNNIGCFCLLAKYYSSSTAFSPPEKMLWCCRNLRKN